jgi:hypothetical protein
MILLRVKQWRLPRSLRPRWSLRLHRPHLLECLHLIFLFLNRFLSRSREDSSRAFSVSLLRQHLADLLRERLAASHSKADGGGGYLSKEISLANRKWEGSLAKRSKELSVFKCLEVSVAKCSPLILPGRCPEALVSH